MTSLSPVTSAASLVGGDGALHGEAQRHGALDPVAGPLDHLLPEGALLAGGVHPVDRLTQLLPCQHSTPHGGKIQHRRSSVKRENMADRSQDSDRIVSTSGI